MKSALRQLHVLGQRLWLDDIHRGLLITGTLARRIQDGSVTGLTSNPTRFEQALAHTDAYDDDIARLARRHGTPEALFFHIALQDLGVAAGLLRPVFERTNGIDGWVSLEVSPLLAHNAARTIEAAAWLHEAAGRPNLFIKIPGTAAGLEAIEESIFAGVPVNVTLLFSREQYVAAAEAYCRGIERRVETGRDPAVACIASLFVGRWDAAVKQEIAPAFHNRLGVAIAMRTYKAYRDLLASPRWQRLAQAGAQPQRLLWASTGRHDPEAPDTLYVDALVAPDTISTVSERTLEAFMDHGQVGAVLPVDGGHAEAVLEEFRREGVDDEALAARLQREGTDAFAASWHATLQRLAQKSSRLAA